MTRKLSFTAVIQNAGGGGAFVEVQFDVEKDLGSQRPRIRATIEGVPYRGILTRMGGDRHMLIILKGIDGKVKPRNATVTTIAPTGTLSILATCSSGVEPLFAVSFVRNVMEGTKLLEINPHFEKVAKERGFWSRELMERIADKGSLHDFDEIPEDVKAVFVTAHDIKPIEHVAMQAAFQDFVDNAVSKTVNFSHSATPKDVEDVYMLAYQQNCKGVTVYRDGSRDEQVLSTGKTAAKQGEPQPTVTKIVPRKRPDRNYRRDTNHEYRVRHHICHGK